MSLFHNFFAWFRPPLERSILHTYTPVLTRVFGYTAAEAKKTIVDMIAICRRIGESEGTANLPADYGDRLIVLAMMNDPIPKRIVDTARSDGATNDDIRTWWDLPDLERRMVLWSEDTFRFATFKSLTEDGFTPEAAASQVHKTFPIYGDPVDQKALKGECRPLPHELRGRVDEFRMKHGAKRIAELVAAIPTYNAFVRDAIRQGTL